MRTIYVIAHDMRSAHNVGSLLRTAEGLGVKKVYLTGYTPYPRHSGDKRLPHLIDRLTARIDKTALGAAKYLDWEYQADLGELISELESSGVPVVALEQSDRATALPDFMAPQKLALLLGSETTGLSEKVLSRLKTHVHIPMSGKKESFNVVQAAAIALYELRFH